MPSWLQLIRDTYGVPARRGARITFRGKPATVIEGTHHLEMRIRVDGEPHGRLVNPRVKIEYEQEETT